MIAQHPVIAPLPAASVSLALRQPVEDRPRDYYLIEVSTSGHKILLPSEKSRTTSSIREVSNEYVELLSNAPWVGEFLRNAPVLDNVSALLPYYAEINKLIVSRRFDLCNNFLRQLRVHELSDILLVGLLRLTSSWKNQLPHWSILLDSANKELCSRGYDSNALLRGLG